MSEEIHYAHTERPKHRNPVQKTRSLRKPASEQLLTSLINTTAGAMMFVLQVEQANGGKGNEE